MVRPGEPGRPRPRTGGRSARVVAAVLDATIDVLARFGYEALTFEAVAATAEVSRTTVHRRWRSKRELVRAAMLLRCDARLALLHDTGSLRGDLAEMVRVLIFGGARDRAANAALVAALTAEYDDPELSAIVRVVRERAERPLFAIVERAIARGDLPRCVAPALVVEPLVATLHLRRAVQGGGDREFSERLLDLVIAGARSLGSPDALPRTPSP